MNPKVVTAISVVAAAVLIGGLWYWQEGKKIFADQPVASQPTQQQPAQQEQGQAGNDPYRNYAAPSK